MRGRRRISLTSLPSKLTITSPALMPDLAAGPPGVTLATSAPCWSLQAHAFGRSSSMMFWMRTPSQPRRVLPNFRRSVDDRLGQRLDGMAKPMPIEPPDGEIDRRVDADHLAVHVEQRAAGIAAVDRGVGLDEVVVGPALMSRRARPRRCRR